MDSNCEAQYYEEKYDNKILALNRETMWTVIQNTTDETEGDCEKYSQCMYFVYNSHRCWYNYNYALNVCMSHKIIEKCKMFRISIVTSTVY